MADGFTTARPACLEDPRGLRRQGKRRAPAFAGRRPGSNLILHVQWPVRRPAFDLRKPPIAMEAANNVDHRQQPRAIALQPARTAILYAVLAGIWIAASSVISGLAVEHRLEAEVFVEIGKGLGFVAATGGLLYLLLERVQRRLQAAQVLLDESRQTTEAQRRRIERIARIG